MEESPQACLQLYQLLESRCETSLLDLYILQPIVSPCSQQTESVAGPAGSGSGAVAREGLPPLPPQRLRALGLHCCTVLKLAWRPWSSLHHCNGRGAKEKQASLTQVLELCLISEERLEESACTRAVVPQIFSWLSARLSPTALLRDWMLSMREPAWRALGCARSWITVQLWQ